VAKTPVTHEDGAGEDAAAVGKGRATPSRREQVAANKRPLVSDPRGSKEARDRQRAAQLRAREGMSKGEERYLPARDKGPQRRFVRDWVDARFSAGELLLPVLALSIVASFLPVPEIQSNSILAVWAFMILVVIDCVVLGFRLKQRLAAKFGEGKVEPGFRWYATMRAVQFKLLRMPKPQVKRGEFPS